MTLFFANNLLGNQNQCSVFLTFYHHKIWDPMMYWMCFDINFFFAMEGMYQHQPL